MYTKILVPLDGSSTAEKVLPCARWFSKAFNVPVELLAVIDVSEMAAHIAAEKARYLDTLLEAGTRRSEEYLQRMASTFGGAKVQCTVDKGRPHESIVAKAAADKGTLVCMATHGRSGVHRWLLGSVTEKVLRHTTNPLLLVRALEEAKTAGQEIFKSVLVPLDGSELAEAILPRVATLAKKLDLAIVLFRAYNIPYNLYAAEDGYTAINFTEILEQVRGEAREYLETKVAELKKLGVEKVSYVAKEGLGADEIIKMAGETPDNLIAMCSHGRSGVKRWVLGSVTENVVRHSGDPVLVVRPE